ncbi:MAG: hypothetical protein V1809_03215 [Planctomycetota bacterium]
MKEVPAILALLAVIFLAWQSQDARRQGECLERELATTQAEVEKWKDQARRARKDRGRDQTEAAFTAEFKKLLQKSAPPRADTAGIPEIRMPGKRPEPPNPFLAEIAQNPAEAARKILAMPPGQARSDALNNLLKAWCAKDPAGAANWAMSLTDSGESEVRVQNVVYYWTGSDPTGARAWAEGLFEGPARVIALKTVAESWIRSDLSASTAWARSLPPGDSRDSVLATLAEKWAATDSLKGAQLLKEISPDNLADDSVLEIAGKLFFQKNNRQAVELLNLIRLEKMDSNFNSLGETMMIWWIVNPEEASVWLAAKPACPARDAAILRLIEGDWVLPPLLTEIPAQFEWANKISEESTRIAARTTIAERWLRTDPAAARAWIVGSSLPEETKQTLLQKNIPR